VDVLVMEIVFVCMGKCREAKKIITENIMKNSIPENQAENLNAIALRDVMT
jgi:hypothetical protein